MIRKQLYIDEALDRALKLVAARTGRSEAHHVREALRTYVRHRLPAPEEDPLAELIGLVEDPAGPKDVAENHDRYLYGPEASTQT